MKYLPIDSKLFIENRKKFVKKMKPNTMAIFHSNDIMPKSADAEYNFRQNPDLFWLTGIDQEESILILYPDCKVDAGKAVLFLRETNKHIAVWEGHKYSKKEATETSGLEHIRWNDEFDDMLLAMMNDVDGVYLNMNEHGRFHTEVPYKDLRFAKEMKSRFPLHQFHRAAPIMHELRGIKSKLEIELLQQAIDITRDAFIRVCKFVKPGVWEHEIEAEIMHEYYRQRATGPAYQSIIASGKNACVLHYVDNNKQCKKGQVILMDFGAEYANYNADLSRSIPVSGKYSKRQRDVYNSVLRIMKKATAMLTPGVLLKEYEKEVGKVTEAELVKLKLLSRKDIKQQDPNNPLYKKYFMHGTSHHLGLDVHDACNKDAKLKPGMVFTVEPGIYIPRERLGIRIENDVLITKKEPRDLMAHIPREVKEIEALMND